MRVTHNIGFDLTAEEKRTVRNFDQLVTSLVCETDYNDRSIIGAEILDCDWDDFYNSLSSFLRSLDPYVAE